MTRTRMGRGSSRGDAPRHSTCESAGPSAACSSPAETTRRPRVGGVSDYAVRRGPRRCRASPRSPARTAGPATSSSHAFGVPATIKPPESSIGLNRFTHALSASASMFDSAWTASEAPLFRGRGQRGDVADRDRVAAVGVALDRQSMALAVCRSARVHGCFGPGDALVREKAERRVEAGGVAEDALALAERLLGLEDRLDVHLQLADLRAELVAEEVRDGDGGEDADDGDDDHELDQREALATFFMCAPPA